MLSVERERDYGKTLATRFPQLLLASSTRDENTTEAGYFLLRYLTLYRHLPKIFLAFLFKSEKMMNY